MDIKNWLESIAKELQTKTNERISFKVGTCESEYYDGDEEYITIKGDLFMTINNGNLFTLVDKEQDITDYFDIFDSNAIIDIDEECFTYVSLPYKISIYQIKRDIAYLNEEFIKYSGAWENEDGDAYGCKPIAKDELLLCKGIAERYPFKYQYKPSEFDENPNDLSEDWSDIKFDTNDFENNDVNENNYEKVDAVAFDFKEELIAMLEQLKTEIEWLPPRFRYEFISEVICTCEQDRHSVRKNAEYFGEAIYDELTKEEESKMFITL